MIRLRRVNAASTTPARPLRDPLLDPRTAAYLEPATLPTPTSKGQPAFGLRLHDRARRPYQRLRTGFLCLLLLLLYLLVYAQETGSSTAPYLVIPPPDSHAAPRLAQPFDVPYASPDESILPVPVTGR